MDGDFKMGNQLDPTADQFASQKRQKQKVRAVELSPCQQFQGVKRGVGLFLHRKGKELWRSNMGNLFLVQKQVSRSE